MRVLRVAGADDDDPYYESVGCRWVKERIARDHHMDVVIKAGLPVRAAMDPWERTVWLRPGEGARFLVEAVVDATLAAATQSLQPLWFQPTPDRLIRRLTSSRSLIIP